MKDSITEPSTLGLLCSARLPAPCAPGLPATGAVLGVDVGFSPKQRSSAVCRLSWDERSITWSIGRFRARPEERDATIKTIAGSSPIEAAAFDGPLRRGFDVIGRYRVAERMLTRRLGAKIGKPGQASAPVGQKLNAAANDYVCAVRRHCDMRPAAHELHIDDTAMVEAFPSAFLGLLLADPSALTVRRNSRSDIYFQHLTCDGSLESLLGNLLPSRTLSQPLADVRNHDDRASLVCAFSALCVAANDYTAVGDNDGWIILPPRSLIRHWAWLDLEANAADESPGCLRDFNPGRTRSGL